MIKAIIFDWHGVLDRVTSAGFVEILKGKTRVSESKILEVYKDLDKKRVIGKINQKEFIDELTRKLNTEQTIIQKAVDYVDTADLDNAVWDILKKLKTKFKIALLTDSSTAKADYIKKLDKLDLFDVKIFSSDEEMSKENPDFFLLASQALGENPQNILHIEDNPKSIETAKKLGFQTHLFKNAEELNNYLRGI